MHVCVYTCILYVTCSISTMRLLGICSGLTIWHWKTGCCALPQGRLPLLLLAFLCAGLSPRGLFHCAIWHWCRPSLFNLHLDRHLGVVSDITRRPNLTANSLILWLLQSFCPLFFSVPRALGMVMFCMYIYSNKTPQLDILFDCDFL